MSNNHRFLKANRLQTRQQFYHLQKNKIIFEGKFLYFEYLLTNELRLGLTVTRAYGNAVKRVQLKRRIREVFRRAKNGLPPIWLNIKPKIKQAIGYVEIQNDFEAFFYAYYHHSPSQREPQKMHADSP